MPLAAGARLGRYVIEAPLGAGGMGDVYLAEDTGLHRRVALKLLPAALAADDTARKRLVREAQAAAGLDHPNICTIYEVGEADGHSYIAMQYVDGETLAARLRRGPLDLASAIALGPSGRRGARRGASAGDRPSRHQAAEHHAHPPEPGEGARLWHRQDVGIRRRGVEHGVGADSTGADAGNHGLHVTRTGALRAVDQRSDIFSFGIVLFETLSRANPFAHASSAETASAILTKDPTVSDIAAPAELRRILRKCLEKDRERRYQTMRDVVIDLENLARDLTAPAAAARCRGDRVTPCGHCRSWRCSRSVAGGAVWWLNRSSLRPRHRPTSS